MGKYDDIINHTHHQSATRPHMSLHDRAAQFAPFAALTGYDDSVKEMARITDERIELSESEIDILNVKQRYLQEHLADEPVVAITYFVPDSKKSGGKYIIKEGIIKRIDEANKLILYKDGTQIPLRDIIDIQSDALPSGW